MLFYESMNFNFIFIQKIKNKNITGKKQHKYVLQKKLQFYSNIDEQFPVLLPIYFFIISFGFSTFVTCFGLLFRLIKHISEVDGVYF